MNNMITDLDGANIRYLALHVLLAGLNNINKIPCPEKVWTITGHPVMDCMDSR